MPIQQTIFLRTLRPVHQIPNLKQGTPGKYGKLLHTVQHAIGKGNTEVWLKALDNRILITHEKPSYQGIETPALTAGKTESAGIWSCLL